MTSFGASSSAELDSLISSIVKTEDELAEENKHGWIKQPPPSICFQNCFKKTYAADYHNWKNIYPEYYWTIQKRRTLEAKIRRHQYKSEEELIDIENQIYKCNRHLSHIPNPRHIYSPNGSTHRPMNLNTLSATPAPAAIPCPTSG